MPQLGPREVGYLVEDSGAKVALVAPALAPVVTAARGDVTSCEALLSLGRPGTDGAIDITAEIAASSPVDSLVDRAGDDLAMLLYTSGTTDRPKGVMLTHRFAVSEEELRAHTAGFVTRFKIPSCFVVQSELPKNAVGKILKREVRESLLGGP